MTTRLLAPRLLGVMAAVGVAVAAVALGGIGAVGLHQSDLARTARRDADRMRAADALQVRLRQLRLRAVVFAADPSPARRAALDADGREVDDALAAARAGCDDPADGRLLDRIEAGRREYEAGLGLGLPGDPPPLAGPALVRWADDHPVRGLVELCRELADRQQTRMAAGLEAGEAQTRWAGRALLGLGLLGAAGGVVGGSAVARAVSRRLARAEELAAVGRLAAGVAHEVRNPLTGIKLLVEAALRPDRPAPLTAADLGMIRDEVGRLERTAQGLLDYARTPPADRRRHDLRDLLAEAADRARGRAAAKAVAVRLDPAPQPLVAVVDRDQFLSAVTNLLANAVDASPPGGEVRVEAGAGRRGMIRVAVTDAGPGVAPAVAGRLFTPFATTKPTGTGLGLVVARRAARDHGGDLVAEHRPGGGASFVLTLPAAGDDANADAPGGG